MSGFCADPLFYDGRIAPCLLESVLSGSLLLISLALYISFRLLGESTYASTRHSTHTLDLLGKKSFLNWRSRIILSMSFLSFILAIMQLIILFSSGSSSGKSSYYYVAVNAFNGLSWFFLYKVNIVEMRLALVNASLLCFSTLALVCDGYVLFTRIKMVLNPSSADPDLFDNNTAADLGFTALKVLMSIVLIIFVLLDWCSLSSYTLLAAEQDDARAEEGAGDEFLDQEYVNSRKSAFSNITKKIKDVLPFVWPKGKLKLQLLIYSCVALMVAGRFVNLLMPLQYKRIVDALTPSKDGTKTIEFPLQPVLLYVLFYFFQGSNGLVSILQSSLWIPVEQYATREVSIHVFRHLHNLSLRWHLNRKTGEVLRVMDKGTQAITSLLSYLWFNIVPVLADISIAVVFFVVQFDIYFGIIVLVTMVFYLVVTIYITEWRTKYRRRMIDLDNKTNARAVDSLLNFETVKYYGNEEFEVDNYKDCIMQYQTADLVSQLSLKVLNCAQNFVITLGLLTGGLLCVARVIQGTLNVGDFVLFITYLQQLYQPLGWFGTIYRVINQNFIDMEKMTKLLYENVEVKDLPGCTNLVVNKGHVVFEDVSFTYDPAKPNSASVSNISFEIPPGKTVALVGPSGGGKSTILRLLFRFYDVSKGRILIDGQDIRYVSQSSLRRSMGVVPQDTVLFNNTVLYNIRYGKTDASVEEVQKAAQMAQIHEKIMSFPEQYQTKVGERGLRLSGGEKQRVAIARTLLKDPKIVLLDEATSALDTNTERAIQGELNKMTSGRTTLVVAHRLSTIVGADMILVIKDGNIAEKGSHAELMALGQNGLYHELWMKQLQNEDKA